MYKIFVLFFLLLSASLNAMQEQSRNENGMYGYYTTAAESQSRTTRSGSLPSRFSNVQISPRNKHQHFYKKIVLGDDEGLIIFGFFEDLLPGKKAPKITQLAAKYLEKEFSNPKFDAQNTPKTKLFNVFAQLNKTIEDEKINCGVVGVIGVVTNDCCFCASLGDCAVMYGNNSKGSKFITMPHVPKPNTIEYTRIIRNGGEVQEEIVKSLRGGKCTVDCKKVTKDDDSSDSEGPNVIRTTYLVCKKSFSRSISLLSLMSDQKFTRLPTSGILGVNKFREIGVTSTPKVFKHTFSSNTNDAEFLLVANGNFWRVMHKYKQELLEGVLQQKNFSKTNDPLNSICKFTCMLAAGKKTLGDLRVMIIPHSAFSNYEKSLDGVDPNLNLDDWRS